MIGSRFRRFAGQANRAALKGRRRNHLSPRPGAFVDYGWRTRSNVSLPGGAFSWRRKRTNPSAKDLSPGRSEAEVITIEVSVRLQALAIPEAVGGYSVIVPALPGCVSQGETLEEVLGNVVEAAEGSLAAGHDHNKEEDLRVRWGNEDRQRRRRAWVPVGARWRWQRSYGCGCFGAMTRRGTSAFVGP